VLSVSRLSPLPLARSTLDRATERRVNPAWVDARWFDPRCRVLVVMDGKAPVDPSGTALVYTSPSRLGEVGLAEAEHYLLGLDGDGVPYFVVPAGPVPDDQTRGEIDEATVLAAVGADRLVSVRDAGHLLSDRDAGVFVHATALVNWHATRDPPPLLAVRSGDGAQPRRTRPGVSGVSGAALPAYRSGDHRLGHG